MIVFSLKDKNLSQHIIHDLKKKQRNYQFMHVCGTHQDTLMKHGLDTLLKEVGINILQGPGCPVCVTTPKEIEEMIVLARSGLTIATYGDMIQVPGINASLKDMQTEGYSILTVYSIEDAVSFAQKNPKRTVVFMAVGFETTAPSTALTLLNRPVKNFHILCCHRTIPPALRLLLEMGESNIDGLIDPGHVSTIIGMKPYEHLTEQYGIPQVIAGFEPIDILMAVWMLIRQIESNDIKVENEYARAVDPKGNQYAQQVIQDIFNKKDVAWRGFPLIKGSGLEIKEEFEHYDARKTFEDILEPLAEKEFKEPDGCRCGEVLRGLIQPENCPLFEKTCTPDHPIGPCMVSVEGSCHISYKYSKRR